ncbi:MAG: hypothetical protein ACFFD1_07505, partial [Candidatus Thorarchaeota archaeon]
MNKQSNLIRFTESTLSGLFPFLWDYAPSISTIKKTASYFHKIFFDSILAWNPQNFPLFLNKKNNEEPWERLKILKEIFKPNLIKIPLITDVPSRNRLFDDKILTNFLTLLKDYQISNIRLINYFNNSEILEKVIKNCLKSEIEPEGTVYINPSHPDLIINKTLIDYYTDVGIKSITLYEPIGTLKIKQID